MPLSNAAPKIIALAGRPMRYEYVANAAITPGHLVELMSSGKIRKHATAGAGNPSRWFADLEEYAGGTIDTAYAGGDQVAVLSCRPGDRVYATVAAGAAAIVAGDVLESAGDGSLRKAVDPLNAANGAADGVIADVTNAFVQATLNNNFKDVAVAVNGIKPGAVARALEAVDNSGGATEVRIMVEVL